MEISAVLSMLQSLGHHSDELLVASDNATAVLVKVQESELGWRVTRMQQLLMSCKSQFGLSYMQSQLSEFYQSCGEAERTYEQVETVLKETMLTGDADEVMLTTSVAQLDQSLLQLRGDQSSLETTIQLAYLLPLGSADSERLERLNSHSHALLCGTKDQCRAVREQLLTHCDNAQKCSEWLQFVAQIERELNSPMAGNFDALLTQRKTLEASFVDVNQVPFMCVFF